MSETNSPTDKPKVVVNSLETDELKKLLEESEETEVTPEALPDNYINDVMGFISQFNIQAGEDIVKSNTLYSIYKVWSKNLLKRQEFFGQFSKFFDSAGTGYYKLNQNAIKLTHEAYSRFKQENIRLKSKHWTRHFEDFLLFYAIKPDNFWIEAPILYFIYDKYTHERGLDYHINTCMSEQVFFTYANLFFKCRKTKKSIFYLVSENILNQFQNSQYERMKKEYGKEKKPKRKRRKPRIKSEI